MRATLTILGSGTSCGVPTVACKCSVCTSTDPHDNRTRTSALLRFPDSYNVLIDCGPDFRLQALREKIDHIDELLITHEHSDHTCGLPDLLSLCKHRNLKIHLASDVLDALHTRFRNIIDFSTVNFSVFNGPFSIHGITFTPVPVMHGILPIHGFRFGSAAFITDCHTIPDSSFSLLTNLDVLIINALQHNPHSTHMSFSESLAAIRSISPRRAFWVHMNHAKSTSQMLEFVAENGNLNVAPAYDGMKLEFNIS